MIRYIVTGAVLAVLALVAFILSSIIGPAEGRGLHSRCNIDWLCAASTVSKPAKVPRNEARRIARAARFRNVEFGSPMYPPETQRNWLSGISKPVRYISGRLICAINVNAALAERASGARARRWRIYLINGAAVLRCPLSALLRSQTVEAAATSPSSLASKAAGYSSGIHRPAVAAGVKSSTRTVAPGSGRRRMWCRLAVVDASGFFQQSSDASCIPTVSYPPLATQASSWA